MHADKTTLNDLSIFTHDEAHSVFHHLDFTRTIGGRAWLQYYFDSPLESLKLINDRQELLKRVMRVSPQWPVNINNGTIMVLQRYFETSIGSIPESPNIVNALAFKIINGPDFSLIDYTVTHFAEFVKGIAAIKDLLWANHNPTELSYILERIDQLLKRPQLQKLLNKDKEKKLPPADVLSEGYFLRHNFKSQCMDLIELYCRLDAFYGMALAIGHLHLSFPTVVETERPVLTAKGLYHPLLPTPVAYDVELTPQQNFLFLTGANMAGKSTFIKAVGVATYMAHIGMAVPATEMYLSFFDGLLSNIQVEDNIAKGESYFFNEVQRIHKTLEKISDGKKWLILIDELFKGTNVQDAMKCSTVVIEGLRKMKNTLFILSTHLYEIGETLRQYPNIQFRYFETEVKDDQLIFSYQLKTGVSNDRLGYLILKREGVVDMLEKL